MNPRRRSRSAPLLSLTLLGLLCPSAATADPPKPRASDGALGAEAPGPRCRAALARAQRTSARARWSHWNPLKAQRHGDGFAAALALNHECGRYTKVSVEISRDADLPSPWHWTERARPNNDGSELIYVEQAVRRAGGWRARLRAETNLEVGDRVSDPFFDTFQEALDTCLESAAPPVR